MRSLLISHRYEAEKYPHQRARARIATLEKEHGVMTAEVQFLKTTIEPQVYENVHQYVRECIDTCMR